MTGASPAAFRAAGSVARFLQVRTYFITVSIAAPLAVICGLRFSTWWPETAAALGKAYPLEWARVIHVSVRVHFVAFTMVPVFLAFSPAPCGT